MEDTPTKNCARCGQPVNRAKDSWNQVGDQITHAVCPTSEAMKALPQVEAGGRTPQVEAGSRTPQVEAVPAGNLADIGVRSLVFLTIEETAKLLRVSASTIRRYIRNGSLPAKRLKGGQTVLIDERDVLGLLEDARGDV